MVLPAFGEQTVPMRVKLAVTFAFTALVAATLPIQRHDTEGSLDNLLIFFLTEPIIGLAFGLGFRLFVIALQTAGVIAAQALSLSQILGGAGVDPMPALGQVLVIAGLAFAVMSGLHVQAARAMIMTYVKRHLLLRAKATSRFTRCRTTKRPRERALTAKSQSARSRGRGPSVCGWFNPSGRPRGHAADSYVP